MIVHRKLHYKYIFFLYFTELRNPDNLNCIIICYIWGQWKCLTDLWMHVWPTYLHPAALVTVNPSPVMNKIPTTMTMITMIQPWLCPFIQLHLIPALCRWNWFLGFGWLLKVPADNTVMLLTWARTLKWAPPAMCYWKSLSVEKRRKPSTFISSPVIDLCLASLVPVCSWLALVTVSEGIQQVSRIAWGANAWFKQAEVQKHLNS